MPKLLLKFQAAVIKEIPIEKTPLTIGRKPDNDITIDNMAVSGHHAKITLQGNSYVIEDLQSTNGTFINDKRIINAALKHNDQILVGQHTLVFVNPETIAASPSAPADADATVVLTAPPKPAPDAGTAPLPQRYPPPAAEKTGILKVIEGKADQGEYVLAGPLTYIGKSETAAIKLKGLFAPDIAALISKRPAGYLITAVKDGYPKLNTRALSGQVELKDGDVIEAGGIKFLFQMREIKPE